MDLNDFLEKAEQVEEINVIDELKNELLYRVHVSSNHETIKKHTQNIINTILPNIEDCYYIEHENSQYICKKAEIDEFVAHMQKATEYNEMYESAKKFKTLFKCSVVKCISDNKITNIRLEWRNWHETCALQKIIRNALRSKHIKASGRYSFYVSISSDECDDHERCKLYCKEQTRIHKIDKIFGLD